MGRVLSRIYHDVKHPASYSTAWRLYTAAKNELPNLKVKQVKRWLTTRDVYTLHKKPRKRFLRRKTLVPRAYHQIQADLIDMSKISKENRKKKFILNVVDCFSRKMWVELIKSKSNKDVVAGFKKIFKRINRKVPLLQADRGLEFYGGTSRAYFKSIGIKLFSTNSSVKSSIVENANKSLQSKLYKHMSDKNTLRYHDVLQDVVESINNRINRSIGMTPNQAALRNNHQVVFDKLYKSYLENKRKYVKYNIGQPVRISKTSTSSPFMKGYLQGFSKQIYTIAGALDTRPVTYRLMNDKNELLPGIFYAPQLSLVNR